MNRLWLLIFPHPKCGIFDLTLPYGNIFDDISVISLAFYYSKTMKKLKEFYSTPFDNVRYRF